MSANYKTQPLYSVGPYVFDSEVYGVNEHGAAAGIGWRGVLDPNGNVGQRGAGAIWTNGFPTFSLPIESASILYEINDGHVAVGLQGFDNSPTEVAIVIKNGTVIPLDGLVGQGTLASDINGAGLVCGSAFFGSGDTRPFVYDAKAHSIVARIDPLPGAGMTNARAINDAGDVVGRSGTNGYLWHQGAMTDLGPAAFVEDVSLSGVVCGSIGAAFPTSFVAGFWNAKQPSPVFTPVALPPGFTGGHAQGINDAGVIVGTCWNAQTYNGTQSAYLHSQGSSVDLNALIALGSGWHLESATDINNRGQIVGYGTLNGVDLGFLLSPPRPRLPDLAVLFFLGGVIFGGGGEAVLPGGPRPVDPSGPLMWDRLSDQKRDTIIALALDEAAQSLTDFNARASIRRAALRAARAGVEAMIRQEEFTSKVSALPALGTRLTRRVEMGKRESDRHRHS